MKQQLNLWALAGLVAILSSCSSGLSGTYKSKDAGFFDIQVEFVSGSKARVTVDNNTREVTYEKNGDEVKFLNPNGGADIYKIDNEGCLTGGGMMLCKEK